ncbi:MFS transporter, partial [Acidiphilium acidophilum]
AHIVPVPWIPVLYAAAMAAEGVASLALGRLLDRFGPGIAILGIVLAALASPLVFLGGAAAAAAGVVLWGVGMATQDTILHAILSELVPPEKRATVYGLFDACRGMAWLAGSVLLGVLYNVSVPALAAVSLLLQLSAVPVFVLAVRSQ